MADAPRPADVDHHHDVLWAVDGSGRCDCGMYVRPGPGDAVTTYYIEVQPMSGHIAAGLLATPPADVTEQAREEVERRYSALTPGGHTYQRGFIAGAEWAAARHTSEAEAGARALDDAAEAANREWMRLKDGPWGSNPIDQAVLAFATKALDWLRDRAAAHRAGGAT